MLAMAAIGGLIRLWSAGRLGLVHFDEGIYALAALWPINPKGFWGLDPTVIAYAPGGYPFLAGLGSFVLGIGDLTPILVSILLGTLTIPAAAWLSWRTFGPTAGAITAILAAFSGFHIAFSRMALTDASFLFFWILAVGMGQRFLERPSILNTIGLGLGVGLVQWVKYHGWLAGAITALAAFILAVLSRSERSPRRLISVWGQGACAAVLAFGVFWPWFQFVESHGGYSDLIRHHSSYMQGYRTWFPHLLVQLDQSAILEQSAGGLGAVKLLAVFLVMVILGNDWRSSSPVRNRLVGAGTEAAGVGIFGLALFGPIWGWGLGIPFLPFLVRGASPARCLVGAWWFTFAILTPFYHPYARLWLPVEASGWLISGYVLSGLIEVFRPNEPNFAPNEPNSTLRNEPNSSRRPGKPRPNEPNSTLRNEPNSAQSPTTAVLRNEPNSALHDPEKGIRHVASLRASPLFHRANPSWGWAIGSLLLLGISIFLVRARARTDLESVSLFGPSDSLRTACRRIQAELPRDLARLRFLGRPPITYYLAMGGVSLAPQPDLDHLLQPGPPGDWALVDDALLRQEPDHAKAIARLNDGWEIVNRVPTTLNLPTLLDLEPGAASESLMPWSVECPLWLLRPRPQGAR